MGDSLRSAALRQQVCSIKMSHRSDPYAALIAAAPDAIITIDEHSTILNANPAVYELFGYTPGELIGKDLTFLMPPELRVRHKEGFARYVRTGVRAIPWTGVHLTAHHHDGKRIEVDVSFAEVQTESGRVFAGIIRDITAKTWAERRLQAQFRIVDLLARSSALTTAGPELLQAIAEPLGWQWGALWTVDGQRVRVMADWPPGTPLQAMGQRTFAKGEGLPGRVWQNARGAWITTLTADTNFPRAQLAASLGLETGMAFPILLQDQVLGVLEFFTTERRAPHDDTMELLQAVGNQVGQFLARTAAQDELRRSHAELERFTAMVSHDLQEPLRSIGIFTDLLQRQLRDAPATDDQNLLGHITSAARRMQILIADLLTYSRASTSDLVREPVQLNQVLASVLEGLAAQIASTGAVITNDLTPTVIADRTAIHQVFQNLLSNSLKYQRPGQPLRIHVSAAIQAKALVCSVADNGTGIPTEYQELACQPFKRLHGPEIPGTGLGLAICKRLIERYGGTLAVTSQPGDGATFTFTIPQ